MTPSQVKEQIKQEHKRLSKLADLKKINRSAIYNLIKKQAQDGARHNGIPEYWRNYIPEDCLG